MISVGGGGAYRSRHHHHFLADKGAAVGFITGIRLLLVDLVVDVSKHDVRIDGLIVIRVHQLMMMFDELVCVGALHAEDGRGALLGRLADAGGDHLSLVRVPQQFPTGRL